MKCFEPNYNKEVVTLRNGSYLCEKRREENNGITKTPISIKKINQLI